MTLAGSSNGFGAPNSRTPTGATFPPAAPHTGSSLLPPARRFFWDPFRSLSAHAKRRRTVRIETRKQRAISLRDQLCVRRIWISRLRSTVPERVAPFFTEHVTVGPNGEQIKSRRLIKMG
jgi:hypothetical protein